MLVFMILPFRRLFKRKKSPETFASEHFMMIEILSSASISLKFSGCVLVRGGRTDPPHHCGRSPTLPHRSQVRDCTPLSELVVEPLELTPPTVCLRVGNEGEDAVAALVGLLDPCDHLLDGKGPEDRSLTRTSLVD